MQYSLSDFTISNLGERKVKSPINLSEIDGDGIYNYLLDGVV